MVNRGQAGQAERPLKITSHHSSLLNSHLSNFSATLEFKCLRKHILGSYVPQLTDYTVICHTTHYFWTCLYLFTLPYVICLIDLHQYTSGVKFFHNRKQRWGSYFKSRALQATIYCSEEVELQLQKMPTCSQVLHKPIKNKIHARDASGMQQLL